eukprot:CAMPEP_0114523694 /NCGR_PEP_ID=MMETSP0109-20121206/21431_1 /TAXON_ID=29199 /ORGANISM="Chlorarachnion reptans, Strain CCCM449" /LENGTH=329 /DNA_ID=CAMNT_0001705033 /DNA_START=217 /DNA_END=1206 /DNA_ORIENTATION=-
MLKGASIAALLVMVMTPFGVVLYVQQHPQLATARFAQTTGHGNLRINNARLRNLGINRPKWPLPSQEKFSMSLHGKPSFVMESSRTVSCNAQESQFGLPLDVSDEADIEVRLFILLQQLRIRHKVAMNKEQEEVAKEMLRSIKELEGLIEERDNRWSPEAMDELRDQLDTQLRTNGPETLRRNLFRKIEAIMNPANEVKFKLGSKVIHKEKRYTGVVCGYHAGCRETDEWVESNGILKMLGATARPFYMVLVDVRDVQSPVVTYVPEEMLQQVKHKEIRKFLPKELQEEQKKPPEVVHPFVYSLFYGQNPNGDYLPTDELMRRYGENRK